MKEIIDYALLSEKSTIKLNGEIRVGIARGFQPFGSPFCKWYQKGMVEPEYFQAMVKYKED